MTNANASPIRIQVDAGDTKIFCLCGKSKDHPYCDGTHASTKINPHIETFEQKGTVYICKCNKSNTKPFCDGSHANVRKTE